MGIPQWIPYYIYEHLELEQPSVKKKGLGRPVRKMLVKRKQALIELVYDKPGISLKKEGRQYNINIKKYQQHFEEQTCFINT